MIPIIEYMALTTGLVHDIGKATHLFQEKLKGVLPSQDPIRHEWVSGILFEMLLKGQTLNDALAALEWDEHAVTQWMPFDKKQGLRHMNDALMFVITTHHGLMGARMNAIDSSFHIMGIDAARKKKIDAKKRDSNEPSFFDAPEKYYSSGGQFLPSLEQKIGASITKIQNTTNASPSALRAAAILSRAFLIMADHTVSARQIDSADTLYANTTRDLKGKRRLNQSLHYHLDEVGQLAATFARNALNSPWKGLEESVVEAILEPATDERFNWQNEAVEALKQARKTNTAPALVMNIAGTGAGKTRMNAKAAVVLCQRESVRFSTALGLRTLTLQTRNAYCDELSIPAARLSCIIGHHIAKKTHDNTARACSPPNDDNNDDDETHFDVVSADVATTSAIPLPNWLGEYSSIARNADKLLAPPILVSTIDYLVAAGEPGRQGHHVLALLRVLNSDLILDEIDDYGSKSFVAVLRLVEIAAMLGSNVITSSATLPFPMARALTQAFASGVKMWSELHESGNASFITGIISNYQPPQIEITDNSTIVAEAYRANIGRALEQMRGQGTKSAIISAIPELSENAFFNSCTDAIESLHENHGWKLEGTDKTISFGLVRISQVKSLLTLATYLARQLPNDFIATYHSDEFMIQRYLKEKTLDHLLTRKGGNTRIIESEYIRSLIAGNPSKSIKFIVIASPVEEVGRDHDFDWAVIEPSSARSIVQTAGRVNRHRLVKIDSPNIVIMSHSIRCCTQGQCENQSHYAKPGFESESARFPTHDMHELLNQKLLEDFSAEVRFGDSRLSQLEDEAITDIIERPVDHMTLAREKFRSAWMGRKIYKDYPLRDRNPSNTYIYVDEIFSEVIFNPAGLRQRNPCSDVFTFLPSPGNTWLSWPITELIAQCKENEFAEESGMTVSLSLYLNENEAPQITYSEAFGFDKSGRKKL